jgi:hypothetical protein
VGDARTLRNDYEEMGSDLGRSDRSRRWNHSNDRDCAALDFAALNTTVREYLDLFLVAGGMGSLQPWFLS